MKGQPKSGTWSGITVIKDRSGEEEKDTFSMDAAHKS